MARDLMLPAQSVVSLLANVFGPAFYDDPRFGDGDPGWLRAVLGSVAGPFPDPWRAVALNPQPLPPGPRYAMGLADANVQEILALDRTGALWGDEVRERAETRGLQLITYLDELCPRWPPKWPKRWPPPPPPPGARDEMDPTELFLFGSRILAGSQVLDQGRLQDALAGLGEKALGLSTRGTMATASVAA